MAITYIHQPNAATVKLDGRVVGKIAHTTDNGGGWTYWPKGWKEHGEVFPTVDEVKRSLESDEEPRTRQDTYTQRRERISDALKDSEALENRFEIPDRPLRYLAVERQSGDAVWAINKDTLADLARSMDESDTKPDDYDIVDLDANGLYFIPIRQTVAFLNHGGNNVQRIDVAPRLLEGAELATVLAALRYWQREGLMSAGCEQDIASDGGRIEPLTEGQIDELCERLNCGE